MPRVERSTRASRDLRCVVWYISQDNPSAAMSWLDEMDRLFLVLAGQPEIGERVRTPRLGIVRRFSRGN